MVRLLGATAAWLFGWHWLFMRVHGKFQEHHLYIATWCAIAASCFWWAGFGATRWDTRFDVFRNTHVGVIFVWAFFTAGAILLYRRYSATCQVCLERLHQTISTQKYLILLLTLLLSIFFAILFFIWRSEFVNSDGMMWKWVIPLNYEKEGVAHVRFDEMWEFYIHSEAWRFMSANFDWSVRLTYQVLSALAGGVFVGLSLFMSRRLFQRTSLVFWLLLLSNGYMQLFFGDVENYTLTGAVLMAYYLSAILYVQKKVPLVVPSAVLSLAMTFHLLSGFLLPSVVFLYVLELRNKRYMQVVISFVASVAVFVGTLYYHDMLSLDRTLRDSWAGNAVVNFDNTNRWDFFALDAYHLEQYNLLLLMFPANALLLPLLIYKRIKLNAANGFFVIAALSMMFFQFSYKGMLGVYNDWNLFANAAVPLAMLVWYNVLNIRDLRYKTEIIIGFLSLSAFYSYTWILTNHYYSVAQQFPH
jgi:hypothetical protein